jgi:hypothetical protein
MRRIDYIDQMLDQLGAVLTPEVAQRIVAMRADEKTQARFDELADKSREGTLTTAEREEYEARLSALSFITVLQNKARRVLARKSA